MQKFILKVKMVKDIKHTVEKSKHYDLKKEPKRNSKLLKSATPPRPAASFIPAHLKRPLICPMMGLS